MPAGAKLAASVSTMLLLISTFFIILSVPGVHSHQCHWCGPLAEQVHRSRRAPRCDEPGDHLTTCDPGYPYCAIVATSPPYVESRYCVKIYQDECYPLFCNSTKTWRMTCPCRGDLCNGANTEREIDSFAVLSKLVAKTHSSRIKKRSTASENQSMDVLQSGEKIIVSENITTNNVEAEATEKSSNTNNEISNIGDVLLNVPGFNLNKDSNNLDEQIILRNNQSTVESTADISTEIEENPNLMQADEPMKLPLDIKVVDIPTNTEILHDKQELTSSTIENERKQTTPLVQLTTEFNIPIVKSTKTTIDIVEGKGRENKTKEKLPTAEALQHNENQASQSTSSDSPDYDIITVTAAETTVLHTTLSTLFTTNTMSHPTNALPKEGKNSAHILSARTMFPVISLCILGLEL